MGGPDDIQGARRTLARRGVLVLHEDNHVLGVCKPAGLLAQGGPPGATPLTHLVEDYRRQAEGKSGRAYVGLVHRLDRNVSGAMVLAKTSKAAGRLAAAFRDRVPLLRKTYLAWVVGHPAEEGHLVHRLRREKGITKLAAPGDTDGREARLSWRVEARARLASRVRIELDTGLPHQIRFQLAFAGHPLYGDVKYGGPAGRRPGLHALELVVPHPVGGAPLLLHAPVPEDLYRLDKRRGMDPPLGAHA
jgi:23S rRNA pseudouridine1911/1915/1917 synthase